MLRTHSLRAALFLPAAAVVAFANLVGNATASTAGQKALTDILNVTTQTTPGAGFTDQKTATLSGKDVTLAKAAADDLVYAVYTAIKEGSGTATDIVSSALENKRADTNKIVARIVDAAILAANANNVAATAAQILKSAVDSPYVTSAGDAVAIAQALKSAPTAGQEIAGVANNGVSGSGAAGIKFQTTVLKLVATDIDSTPAYVNSILATLGSDRLTTGLALAKGVKTLPAVIGNVVAGVTQGAADTVIVSFVNQVLTTLKPKGLGEIVAGGLSNLSIAANIGNTANGIVTSAKVSSANVGFVASGALQALTSRGGLTVESTNSILTTLGQSLTGTALINFIGNSAGRNEARASEIITFAGTKFTATDAAARANLIKVGSAVIKSISFTGPDNANDAAFTLAQLGAFTTGTGSADRKNLAVALAVGSKTSFAAAGAAVAGVVRAEFTKSGTPSGTQPATAADFASAAILKASKAATNIAFSVSSLPNVTTNGTAFATSLANLAPKSRAQIAAGVAISHITTAGDITAAVATQDAKNALKIAGTVATLVDVEGVSQIGRAMGELVGTVIPKVSSLTSLAATLTKAINLKPVASLGRKEFTWKNRVDEIGELAAVLTNAALKSSQVVTANRAATLAAIGNSILKAVGTKFFINAGNQLADLNDIAKIVTGSIFEVIQNYAGANLSGQDKSDLVAANNPLLTALLKGKKNNAVTQINSGYTAAVAPGLAFETTSVYDPETPIKNL